MDIIRVFYSYAPEDEHLRRKLEMHLSLLQQQGLIAGWHDRDISAGREWEQEISDNLDSAQIILLLVSASFLASKYCYSREMTRALERHADGSACVIPIILRPVYWENAPFCKLQALPTGAKPVTGRGWHNRDEAFADIAHGISKIVQGLRLSESKRNQTPSPKQIGQILSSQVTLINASLDPHDSTYTQSIEQGKKIIRPIKK